MRLSAGWTRLAPSGKRPMLRRSKTGARSMVTALRSRQPTATQGLEGTNEYCLPIVTTETSWTTGRASRNS